MPPKARRKTDRHSTTTTPTAKANGTSNAIAAGSLKPAARETSPSAVASRAPAALPEDVQYLLEHGRLRHPPHTYLDIFLPILQYALSCPGLGHSSSGSNSAGDATPRDLLAPSSQQPHIEEEEGKDKCKARAWEPSISVVPAPGAADHAAPSTTAVSMSVPRIAAADLTPYIFPSAVVAHLTGLPLHAAADEQPNGHPRGDGPAPLTHSLKRSRSTAASASAVEETPRDVAEEIFDQLVDVLSSTAFAQAYLPPYRNDSEYLRGVDTGYILAQWRRAATALDMSAAFLTLTARAGLDVFRHVVPTVKAATAVYEAHCAFRLAAMAMEPRVVRVGRRLALSAQETRVLTFLLMCHSGSLLQAQKGFALTLNVMAHFTGLTPQEALDFVSTHRLHVKQGLVTSDGQNRSSFADSRYSLPQEAVAALTGNELTEEQLIKLERTALADVLTEEREMRLKQSQAAATAAAAAAAAAARTAATPSLGPHPHIDEEDNTLTRGNSTAGTHSETGGEDDGYPSEGNSDGEDLDGFVVDAASVQEVLDRLGMDAAQLPGGHTVASIQAAVQQRVQGKDEGCSPGPSCKAGGEPDALTLGTATTTTTEAAGTGNGGATEGQDATSAPESLMHKPYATDFEYMEEAFKTLASLIKLRTAEGDMKDEDDGYVPRTKVEATMRELKGKVRVSRAIHSSRVAATLALAEKVEQAEREKRNAETARTPPPVDATAEGNAKETPVEERRRALLSTEPDPTRPTSAAFIPRIEQLSQRLHLGELEKNIMLLMVGSVVSHDILVAINGRYVMRDGQQRYLTVGYLLFVLCDGLQERVAARRHFYQSAPLIANGILSLGIDGLGSSRSKFNTDLMDYVCDVDRKMVDYVMGSATETAEMVPGSSLYYPTVPMDNVVLPSHTTKLVLSTIEHYGMFERCKKKCGFGEGLGSTASGLAILFYGPSGTGKTMLANAVAHEMKKRLLLVNVSQFKAEQRAPEMMRFIFREAKLNDAIIFFDECEALFESRETNPLVTSVLTEFEKNDGLLIMATNMAQVMDEAMNRRISLMVEFKLPSHPMREKIWQRHMPRGVALAPDVSLEKLALNYELSGGLIRNAVLAALNHAIGRENTESPTLQMEDLEEGAKLQLRGFFLAAKRPGAGGGGGGGGSGGSRSLGIAAGGGDSAGSEAYLTPRRTLKELVMEPIARRKVEMVARVAKSRSTLFSQWGFTEETCLDQGSVYLFSGPSGTGKSLAAEGIAYECGATIRLCNVSELLLLRELNIAAVFEEGRQLGAVIVFDEAQELFTHSERALHISQLIQYYSVRYPKPVIVIATTGGGGAGGGSTSGVLGGGLSERSLDVNASRIAFTEHVSFKFPDRTLRKELWRGAFPSKVPLAEDVDFDRLCERRVSAKLVRRVAFAVCCRAAATAASASDGETAKVNMKMIEDELTRCILAEEGRNPARNMFA